MVTQFKNLRPLDQHALDHLYNLILCGHSVVHIVLEIWIHKLVKTAYRMVMSCIFNLIDQMDEPEKLHCLIKGSRRQLGYAFTGFCNTQQLPFPFFILFLCRHFTRQVRIPMGKFDCGI